MTTCDEKSLFSLKDALISIFSADLGEFNHMIRKQLNILHSCSCAFCTKKRADEEAAEKKAADKEAAKKATPVPKKK